MLVKAILGLTDLLEGRNSLGSTCLSREDRLEQEAGLASSDWSVLTVGPGTRLRGPTLASARWWFSVALDHQAGGLEPRGPSRVPWECSIFTGGHSVRGGAVVHMQHGLRYEHLFAS